MHGGGRCRYLRLGTCKHEVRTGGSEPLGPRFAIKQLSFPAQLEETGRVHLCSWAVLGTGRPGKQAGRPVRTSTLVALGGGAPPAEWLPKVAKET
jgi:hypothetical protein